MTTPDLAQLIRQARSDKLLPTTHPPRSKADSQFHAGLHYGIRYGDGSVYHPWNGATQVRQAIDYLRILTETHPGVVAEIVVMREHDDPQRWDRSEANYSS